VDFHLGKLALADGDQVKAQDYLRQSGYKVSISPLSLSHHFPKTRCQARLLRRSGSRKLFRAGSMRCRDSGQRVSGRPAFLSHNRLFRVNQRGRKYPLHAGKGLFTSGVRSATGRFALRAFAYTRYWELASHPIRCADLCWTQMLLRPVLSSFVAFTAMSAFIGLPRRVLSFALQATWRGAQKSKCPSWRGKATVRPRCQGRRVVAFIGAKRRPFTAGGTGAGFGREGQIYL